MTEEEGVIQDLQEDNSWLYPSSWCRWKPTSMAALAQAERKILKHLWNKLDSSFVKIFNGSKCIRTIIANKDSKNYPLVMLHGMGSGIGLWALNIEALAQHRPVYAMDLLGFGRSSRPNFSNDGMLAEMEFVEAIEEWRKEIQLEKFILLGHSLGGFLASAYAMRYPERLHHVILVDPWGFPEKPTDPERKTQIPIWIKMIAALVEPFNPFAGLRIVGPFGPGLVRRLRPDLASKFNHLYRDDTVSNYIYHCNAQTPSGEAAFKSMMTSFGWAKYPMSRRLGEIEDDVSMTMVFGSRSWIDNLTGYEVKFLRSNSYVDVQIIENAGHHVYADQSKKFNSIVNNACDIVDKNLNKVVKSKKEEVVSWK